MPDFLSSIPGISGISGVAGASGTANLKPLGGLDSALNASETTAVGGSGGSSVGPAFGEVVGQFLGQVNGAQGKADAMVESLALGEPVDVHQVMMAMNDASNAMQLTLQVRNKALDAYQELMRLPI